MKLIISLLFIIFSIIGIVDSGYLTYEKIIGSEVICGSGFDCGKVLSSSWASIGPIPLSAFGLLFYTTMFIFSLLHFLEIDLKKYLEKISFFKVTFLTKIKADEILAILSCFGFIFSFYLVVLMAFVIKAWCLFCLVSAATSTTLFFLTWWYFVLYGYRDSIFLKSMLYHIFDFGYSHILKPIFFLFDPLTIHETMVRIGVSISSSSLVKKILTAFFAYNHSSLQRTFKTITFINPIGLAAGFDYDGDLPHVTPALGFGFQTIGTVTLGAYEGNPSPQLVRLPKSKSILVNKGLKNGGAKKIIKKLENNTFNIPIGISIASTNKHYDSIQAQILDICACFSLFEKSTVRHSYYELNISCPNTFGGEPFTTKKRLTALLMALSNLKITKPVFVKMPIELEKKELKEVLDILANSFVTGVVFGNLSKNKANKHIAVKEKKLVDKFKGNLSGKPTWELSNELIRYTRKQYKDRFIIIGTGGVFSPEDAAKKLDLGADLVQLITGMIFTGPQLIGEINQYLHNDYFAKQFSPHQTLTAKPKP